MKPGSMTCLNSSPRLSLVPGVSTSDQWPCYPAASDGGHRHTMVSMVARNLRKDRVFQTLCELFDKADTGGDGTISIPEYIVMCEEYGIEITEDHIESVRAIANENGEVRKSDFISHIKASNMYSLFESTDEGSSTRWQNVAITAFKLFDQNYDGYIDKKEFKWMTTSAKVSNKTIDIVFSRCDTDGNGKLDYQEFKAMIFRSKQKKDDELRAEEEKAQALKKKGKGVKKDISKKGKKSKGKK